MNNFIIDNSDSTKILKYAILQNKIIAYQVKIISSVSCTIFLKFSVDDEYLYYDTSSLMPVNIYFKNYCIDYKTIRELFRKVIDVIDSSKHFLLDIDSIVVNEDYIYYDTVKNEVRLIYLPLKVTKKNVSESVRNLFLSLIFRNIEISEIAKRSEISFLVDNLQSNDFDMNIFKQHMNYHTGEIQVTKKESFLKRLLKSKKKDSKKITPVKHKEDVEHDEATILLVEDEYPKLVFEDNKIITINKDNFLIGRSKKLADYSLSEELSLGRVHAEIIREDSSYYIMDIHTKNGTFINNKRISSKKKIELKENDAIRFASKEAVFKSN